MTAENDKWKLLQIRLNKIKSSKVFEISIIKEAMKWFKLAADQGNEQAKKNFEIVKNLEKQLLEKK